MTNGAELKPPKVRRSRRGQSIAVTIAVALLAAVFVIAPSDALAAPSCGGLAVTVDLGLGQQPTPFDDVILGTPSADEIRGRGGDDVMCGLGGDDTLYGGSGNDTAYGQVGDDEFFGGPGDDRLYGNAGNDTLNGGAGEDLVRGGPGDDELLGNTDNDRLFGDAGADVLRGHAGDDLLYGGDDDDQLFGGDGLDATDGGAGTNICDGETPTNCVDQEAPVWVDNPGTLLSIDKVTNTHIDISWCCLPGVNDVVGFESAIVRDSDGVSEVLPWVQNAANRSWTLRINSFDEVIPEAGERYTISVWAVDEANNWSEPLVGSVVIPDWHQPDPSTLGDAPIYGPAPIGWILDSDTPPAPAPAPAPAQARAAIPGLTPWPGFPYNNTAGSRIWKDSSGRELSTGAATSTCMKAEGSVLAVVDGVPHYAARPNNRPSFEICRILLGVDEVTGQGGDFGFAFGDTARYIGDYSYKSQYGAIVLLQNGEIYEGCGEPATTAPTARIRCDYKLVGGYSLIDDGVNSNTAYGFLSDVATCSDLQIQAFTADTTVNGFDPCLPLVSTTPLQADFVAQDDLREYACIRNYAGTENSWCRSLEGVEEWSDPQTYYVPQSEIDTVISHSDDVYGKAVIHEDGRRYEGCEESGSAWVCDYRNVFSDTYGNLDFLATPRNNHYHVGVYQWWVGSVLWNQVKCAGGIFAAATGGKAVVGVVVVIGTADLIETCFPA